MKIIITGGAGYIGSHMVLLLIQNGHIPIVIDSFVNSNEYNLNKIKEITSNDFIIYKKDVLEDLSDIDTNDVDAIIHFAALKAVGESVEKPAEYYKNNVAGTINVTNFALSKGIKNLIFSSTAAIYSEQAEPPFNEESPVYPANPYGWTKYLSERVLQDTAQTGRLNSVALRYFNVAGNQEDGLIGEIAKDPKNLIPSIIVSHLGYRPTSLKIFGKDYPTRDGTAIRDYIHVLDLCEAHLKALEYLQDHSGHFTFNLGSKNGSTILEVLKTFEEVTGTKLNYEIVNRRRGDIPVSIADPTAAKKVLNWEAERDLKQMLDSSWKWYKSGFRKANNL